MSLSTINSNNIFMKDVIGNVRKAQEDSNDVAIMTPNGDAFIVCDGMGGHVGGKQASSIAVKCIIEYLKKEAYSDIEAALKEALEFANTQILFHAAAHPELRGMGTTACIVLLKDDVAYVAHIGDSRIYLYLGKEQQLHRVTKDHSYVQALVDNGEITADEAENHPDKNRILKALGIQKNISPTINVVQPKNDDIFLICSDGLSDMLSDKEIRATFLVNAPISDTGESLIKQALYAGGLDNITIHLIRITNSDADKSTFKSFTPRLKDPINPNGCRDNNTITSANNKSKKSKTLLLGLVIALLLVIIGVAAAILFTDKEVSSETMEDKIEQLNSERDDLTAEQTEIINKLNNDNTYKRLYDRYNKELSSDSKSNTIENHIVSQGVIDILKHGDSINKEAIVKNIFTVINIDFSNDSIDKFIAFANMTNRLNSIAERIKNIDDKIEEYKQLSDYDNDKTKVSDTEQGDDKTINI